MCRIEEFSDETYPIRFAHRSERGIYGRTDEGIVIFIDRRCESKVAFGDTWLCRLAFKSTESGAYGFAIPVTRMENTEVTVRNERRENIVVAVGNDVLFSDNLRPGRYEAYRSPDGSMLQLIPSETGDIECGGNSVRIDGIDRFVGQVPRNLDFCRIDDCYLIKLEE